MERFDLYDRDRRLTGMTARRGDPIPPDSYRLAIHVCLFGEDGRLLIQQRQPFKRKWSGLWDLSAAGSAICGESSYGADVDENDANQAAEQITARFPDADISVVNGGQPVYYYMISVE